MGEVIPLQLPKPPFELRVWHLHSGDLPLCWEVARCPHHMDWFDPLAHFDTKTEALAWAAEYAAEDARHWFSGDIG